MAGQGYTKVQAVSYVLMWANRGVVSALGSGTGEDKDFAEVCIDQAIMELACAFHPAFTTVGASLTASSGEITVGSLTVAVRGTTKYKGVPFRIFGQKVAGPTGVTFFGTSEVVLFDIAELASASSPANFENLDPATKVEVMQRAAQNFRAMKVPDPMRDAALARNQREFQAVKGAYHKPSDPAVIDPNSVAHPFGQPLGGMSGGQASE